MKKLINLILFVTVIMGLNGCVQEKKSLDVPVLKTKETKIKTISKEIPLPYVQETKYIKILVLPFENAENDIDYGGYIETKLEPSKFVFDDNIKNKILNDDTIGGI
jgi:hypothetical protein